jgi:hypothetical protein
VFWDVLQEVLGSEERRVDAMLNEINSIIAQIDTVLARHHVTDPMNPPEQSALNFLGVARRALEDASKGLEQAEMEDMND